MSLRDDAMKVRENAHAPYSNFKVGAAVRARWVCVAVSGQRFPSIGGGVSTVVGRQPHQSS